MKRTVSIILSLVLIIFAIASTPVAALQQGVSDVSSTQYRDGYVLHNMDFTTGEIKDWSQTGYTEKCANTSYTVSNNFKVNADAKYQSEGIDGSTMKSAGINSLRCFYNDSNAKTGKRTIWLTNNDIPQNISCYTVEFKVLVHKRAATNNYFGLAYGDATSQNATKDMIVKFDDTVAGTAKSTEDTNAYASIIDLLEADQTQANWITYRVIVNDLSAAPTIQISCGDYTAEFTATNLALSGKYMGLIMSDGLNLNIAHIRVIAGTDYENLIWPEGKEALVQSVGADACYLSVKENETYAGWVQRSVDKDTLNVILATTAELDDNNIEIEITYNGGMVRKFTLPSTDIKTFKNVEASGRTFVANTGTQLFGVSINKMSAVMDSVTEVKVTYDTFSGTATFN